MTHHAEAPGCQTDARHRNRGPPGPLAGGGEAGGGGPNLRDPPISVPSSICNNRSY